MILLSPEVYLFTRLHSLFFFFFSCFNELGIVPVASRKPTTQPEGSAGGLHNSSAASMASSTGSSSSSQLQHSQSSYVGGNEQFDESGWDFKEVSKASLQTSESEKFNMGHKRSASSSNQNAVVNSGPTLKRTFTTSGDIQGRQEKSNGQAKQFFATDSNVLGDSSEYNEIKVRSNTSESSSDEKEELRRPPGLCISPSSELSSDTAPRERLGSSGRHTLSPTRAGLSPRAGGKASPTPPSSSAASPSPSTSSASRSPVVSPVGFSSPSKHHDLQKNNSLVSIPRGLTPNSGRMIRAVSAADCTRDVAKEVSPTSEGSR